MIIQSKKIWLADQFVAGQIEIVDGKIVGIYDYDEKEVDERNCESISDEQIEEFMVRKRFVNRLATARLRNMDFLSHEDDEIEKKEKQYAGK